MVREEVKSLDTPLKVGESGRRFTSTKMAAKDLCLPLDVENEIDFLRHFYPKADEFQWNRDACSGTLYLIVNVGDGLYVGAVGKGFSSAFQPYHPSSSQKREFLVHLPPVRLDFTLFPSYPEESPPSFNLTCSWLNFSSLSKLCKQLERMWSPGSVVLYDWADFITNEAVQFLSISSPYTLVVEDPSDVSRDCWDDRAIQDISRPSELIPLLIEYNQRKEKLLFSDHRFTCSVCFQTLSGAKCKCIPKCGHVYCIQCLLSYIEARIEGGLIGHIKCPAVTCECDIPHWLVKEVLPIESFYRFDQLLLQKSLDQMEDLVYCPRPSCRHPNIKELGSQMAICANCKFCFCSLCHKSWHGSESGCDISLEEFEDIKEKYNNGTSEERETLERRYGKKLKKTIEMLATKEWLDRNTKCCPICKASVQKSAGCNKMTCTSCGGFFCWLCLQRLGQANPYRHYSIIGGGSCSGRLFEGIINDDENFDDFE